MSKRALLRAVAVTGAARQPIDTGSPGAECERTESKLRNSRTENADGRSSHCRCKMLRSRIVRDQCSSAADERSRRKNSEPARSVPCTSLGKLRNNSVAELDVSVAANYDNVEFRAELYRKLRIKRPALGSPRTARCKRDEWPPRMREALEEKRFCGALIIG